MHWLSLKLVGVPWCLAVVVSDLVLVRGASEKKVEQKVEKVQKWGRISGENQKVQSSKYGAFEMSRNFHIIPKCKRRLLMPQLNKKYLIFSKGFF